MVDFDIVKACSEWRISFQALFLNLFSEDWRKSCISSRGFLSPVVALISSAVLCNSLSV